MYSQDEIVELLQARGNTQELLFQRARDARAGAWQDTVFLRGVIEITNMCRVDCEYCPMRRSNQSNLTRFLSTAEQIVMGATAIKDCGINVVFLQGGEVPQTTKLVLDVLPKLHTLFDGNVEHLLCLGNKSEAEYTALREAGANSYILKHETADPILHEALRHESLQARLDSIRTLLRLGYRVGTGTIVGLPGQTLTSIAKDILLAKQLGVQMASASPFIPAEGTPLTKNVPGDVSLTLNAIAVMRLVNPQWLIPSVSALSKLDADGQARGIMAGANVLTVNFTSPSMKDDYLIYGKSRYIVSMDSVKTILRQTGLKPRRSCWTGDTRVPPHIFQQC